MVAAAGLLLLGCQSYDTGLAIICDAPAANPECMGADDSSRGSCLMRAIEPQLEDAEAREFFESLANLDERDRARALRAAAHEAGQAGCPMADVYDRIAEQAAADPPP